MWEFLLLSTWDLPASLHSSSSPSPNFRPLSLRSLLNQLLRLYQSLPLSRTHKHTHIRPTGRVSACESWISTSIYWIKNHGFASNFLRGSARCAVKTDDSDLRVSLDWPTAAGEDWCYPTHSTKKTGRYLAEKEKPGKTEEWQWRTVSSHSYLVF